MTLMRRTMLTFTMTEFLELWPLKKLRLNNVVEPSLEEDNVMTRFLSIHLSKLTVPVIFAFILGGATIAQQPAPSLFPQPTSASALPEFFALALLLTGKQGVVLGSPITADSQ